MTTSEPPRAALWRYLQEIIDSRTHVLLNTNVPINQKQETEIGLALSAIVVKKCHKQLEILEQKSATDDEGGRHAASLAVSHCANDTAERAIEQLISNHGRSERCGIAHRAHMKAPDDRLIFDALLACCAQSSLDSLSAQLLATTPADSA